MRKTGRFPRLCRPLLGTVSALVAFSFCATAWADSGGKNVVAKAQPATPAKHATKYYVLSTASSIPVPLEQLGVFPTTTHPIQIIGRRTQVTR
jgi:hypothetical protein